MFGWEGATNLANFIVGQQLHGMISENDWTSWTGEVDWTGEKEESDPRAVGE